MEWSQLTGPTFKILITHLHHTCFAIHRLIKARPRRFTRYTALNYRLELFAQSPQVIYDGFPWVAKRFNDTGMGEGTVEIQENRLQLIKEACWLRTTQYFLEQFITAARQQDVDIEKDIEVTDFKLGVEVIEAGAGPSIASGFSLEQYEAVHEEDQSSIQEGIVVWLFEPRRNSKVRHWSGTNEYPPWHNNKLGSTLNAFAHYTYLLSQESTVLADIQSMC
ncbi:hypothetical protein B0H14DRAFT_2343038 [Mycena olivaceomarginata]|nr:hypothetical protein B0H14DRAFT_2343038 [Mycena olivaceomarginata]